MATTSGFCHGEEGAHAFRESGRLRPCRIVFKYRAPSQKVLAGLVESPEIDACKVNPRSHRDHHRHYNSRPHADRRPPHLGAQLKMGLWSEWRSWHGPFDPAHSVFDAHHLARECFKRRLTSPKRWSYSGMPKASKLVSRGLSVATPPVRFRKRNHPEGRGSTEEDFKTLPRLVPPPMTGVSSGMPRV
jgi:hypothetical protein